MVWEVEKCDILKECPLFKGKIPILFQPEDLTRIKALLKKFESKEWLMYLYGDINPNGVIISGMTIPKQEVSGGSVDNIEAPLGGCIGTIHSHNSMGAFHSGTDEKYLEANHRVCITVNNNMEFSSTVDLLSECKRPMQVKGEVFRSEPPVDLTEFLKEADENITEHKVTYTQYDSNYYNKMVWDHIKGEWVGKNGKDEKKEDKKDLISEYTSFWL